jgi:uncharacterized protein (TIGR00251 family)
MMEWIHSTCTGYLIKIQVAPGAAENQIVGPYGGRLKIRIAAVPEKGAANKVLLDFLAQRLGLTKNSLRLKSGSRDRTKVVEIISLEPQIRERLLSLWPPSSVSRPDCPKRPG